VSLICLSLKNTEPSRAVVRFTLEEIVCNCEFTEFIVYYDRNKSVLLHYVCHIILMLFYGCLLTFSECSLLGICLYIEYKEHITYHDSFWYAFVGFICFLVM
jgi:hypothetical protein